MAPFTQADWKNEHPKLRTGIPHIGHFSSYVPFPKPTVRRPPLSGNLKGRVWDFAVAPYRHVQRQVFLQSWTPGGC